MYTKKEFRKMIINLDMPLKNVILVFYDKDGVFIYKVNSLEAVDETIYDTDELYMCEVSEVIYTSQDPHKIGAFFDFSIDDIYEIKDARTDKVLYRKS